MSRKTPDRSFRDEQKEPVIERIGELARKYASRSAAARAWGINVNTLNSYFKHDAARPMPRENLLSRIAESEGVPLDWLMGITNEKPKTINDIDFRDGLTEMLSYLTVEERAKLASILARKGVDTMVYLLFKLADLTPSELERVARLAQQVKEGDAEDSEANKLTTPQHKEAS